MALVTGAASIPASIPPFPFTSQFLRPVPPFFTWQLRSGSLTAVVPHNRAVESSKQPKPYLAAPGEGIQTNWSTLGYSMPRFCTGCMGKKWEKKGRKGGKAPEEVEVGYGKLPMLTELSPCRDSNLN